MQKKIAWYAIVLGFLLLKGNVTKSHSNKYHVSGSCYGNLLSRIKKT